MAYIAAIDQGTTSSRCIVFDQSGGIVSVAQREHRQIFPKPGWVEHDATEIWANVRSVVRDALAQASLTHADIAAFGSTNQRETTVVWDRETGEPVHNTIVWQNTRTDALIKQLGDQDRFRERGGLPLATYFSWPKLRWLLDHVDGLRERADRGDGTTSHEVVALGLENPALLERVHPDGPDIWAQVEHARRTEWASEVDDVLRRRTTVMVRGLDSPEIRSRVSELLAS